MTKQPEQQRHRIRQRRERQHDLDARDVVVRDARRAQLGRAVTHKVGRGRVRVAAGAVVGGEGVKEELPGAVARRDQKGGQVEGEF